MSKTQWHDPTDWVIANYQWPAGSSAASGATESGRLPSLLRLRPEDLGLGLASPLSRRQVLTRPAVDGQTADERHSSEPSLEDNGNLLHQQIYHHHQQQHQQLGNDDSDVVIDPLVCM